VKYSTVQNWYPGDENGVGGIYNFVTKRADCRGDRAKVMWTQVETGSAITWKYPSCILRGDDSQGEFYSIAIANNAQQADTGTKMIHLGKNARSRASCPRAFRGPGAEHLPWAGLHAPQGQGQPQLHPVRQPADRRPCGAHTVPYIEVRNSSRVEHEATTSKVDDDQLFYCRSRGMDEEEAVALVVNGFCRTCCKALPMEFAMEAQSLVAISLEGSVG
jgi:Fe-S cluster assembly protein SufB